MSEYKQQKPFQILMNIIWVIGLINMLHVKTYLVNSVKNVYARSKSRQKVVQKQKLNKYTRTKRGKIPTSKSNIYLTKIKIRKEKTKQNKEKRKSKTKQVKEEN